MSDSDTSAIRLDLLGRMVEVRAPKAWVDLITDLWGPFAAGSDQAPEAIFEILLTADGWTFRHDDGSSSVNADPWSALHTLRGALIGWCLKPSLKFVLVHASAVSKGKTTVMLPGPAGAGKTTLSTELALRGWMHGSDDLVAIEPHSLRAHPFPQPLNIRNRRLIEKVEKMWVPPRWLPPPGFVFLVPPASVGPLATEPTRPTHVIFVRFEPSASSTLRELSPAEAAARLALNARPVSDPSRVLRALSRLARETSSAALTYRSSSEGASLVEGFASRIAVEIR